MWNYLDIIPPILLLAFIPFELLGFFDKVLVDGILVNPNGTLEATMQATMSLFLWLKLLYFLRIFQSTGYLIRIIIEVVYDMRHFMFVLMLTFVAFGDAMLSISSSNEDAD